MDQNTFDFFTFGGSRFIKTIEKKNPRKERFENSILYTLDQVNSHLNSDPKHSVKIELGVGLFCLDLDAHEGSTLNTEQIDLLNTFCIESGFMSDRTPRGLHIFFKDDTLALSKIKVSRFTSLGFVAEVFPPKTLVNIYKPMLRNGVATLEDLQLTMVMVKGQEPMTILGQCERHNGVKKGLLKFRPKPKLRRLFNHFWCKPPLPDQEFDEIAVWVDSLIETQRPKEQSTDSFIETQGPKERQNGVTDELLVIECQRHFQGKFLYCPWNDHWLERIDDLRPVYRRIPDNYLNKIIFDFIYFEKGHLLKARKIKELVQQLLLLMQKQELVNERVHCFNNGCYFVQNKQFVQFSDERLLNVVLSHNIPVDYYDGIVRPIPVIWEKFLSDLLRWESVKAEEILALIVAHIMGLIKNQAIYYLGGPPRSGKSLVMSLIVHLFRGEVASFTVAAMNANPRFFISFLVDKTFLFLPDCRLESMTQRARDELKRLTGGDPLSAETKSKNVAPSLTGSYPVIISSSSELSAVQDAGISKRLVYIRFKDSIKLVDVDPELQSRLCSDMGWLIDRAILMTQSRANEIIMLIAHEYATKFTPTQVLTIYHTDHLEFGESLFESTSNLYTRYVHLCGEIGLKPTAKSTFTVNLIQIIGIDKEIALCTGKKGGVRGIAGIKLIDLILIDSSPGVETPISTQSITTQSITTQSIQSPVHNLCKK